MKANECLFPLFGNIKSEGRKGNQREHFTLILSIPLTFIHPQNEGERREMKDF